MTKHPLLWLTPLVILVGCSQEPPPPPVPPNPVAPHTVLVSSNCYRLEEACEFTYELRAPASLSLPPETVIEWFAGSDHEGGSPVFTMPWRLNGPWRVYTSDKELQFGDDYAGKELLMVVLPEMQPAQAFRFAQPTNRFTTGWTPWQRPDFTQLAESPFDVAKATAVSSRSTNTPPDCLEFRYKFAACSANDSEP